MLVYISRSPLGLRGLKSSAPGLLCRWLQSQPSWAAWIEIRMLSINSLYRWSQPSWAAWIEIAATSSVHRSLFVAALLGCVD